jgi:hypothetical protein
MYRLHFAFTGVNCIFIRFVRFCSTKVRKMSCHRAEDFWKRYDFWEKEGIITLAKPQQVQPAVSSLYSYSSLHRINPIH